MSSPVQTSPTQPDAADRASYYAAALRALRFIERRTPTTRRFGAEADARWAAFHGNLETADRLDLLIRDADAHWPASFGARNVFALRAAAEDEAFGAEWLPLDPVDAGALWHRILAEAPPAGVRETLSAAAAAWDLALGAFDAGAITPTDRLLVVGPSAVAAVVAAFATGKDLDWADQVVCVATPPAHRQIAALGAALLGVTKPTLLASPASKTPVGKGRRLVASSDAAPDDAAFAHAAAAR
ncbi:MAG: hypothetical protein ABJE95_23495 [Byssovorax sp.]